MRRKIPWLQLLHPFLFGMLSIVSLLEYNIGGAPILHAIRPGIASLLITVAVLYLCHRWVRDWEHAALLASFFLILFFSYGHIYGGLIAGGPLAIIWRTGLVGHHPPLLLVAGGIFALAAYAIHRARLLRPVMTRVFTLMGMVAITFPAVKILSHELQLAQPWDLGTQEPLLGNASTAGTPDIYLIVLDGYGRSDVLQNIYDYDNSDFIDGLQGLGFFVATQARSNYTQTALSLASTLNMSYLDPLRDDPGATSNDRRPLARLIRWSRLRGFLEANGYNIVAMSTGYRMTELENAETFLREPLRAMTTLERFLLETSGAVILQELPTVLGYPPYFPGYQAHRDRVLFEIETLQSVASLPGPKFVMAHLLVPHPPFVFDQNGSEPPRQYPFSTRDGDEFVGTQEQYIRGYRQQIAYVDRVMIEVLAALLADSPSPPVIVLMGDHGPGSRLVWDSAEESDLLERSAILNAYLLPGISDSGAHETITPVNSFRLILDAYFGTHLGPLPDRSYFSALEQPFSFVPIEG